MALNKYKIMLIGDSSVGKTCTISRYCKEQYLESKATIGCDINLKTINLEGENIRLEIWDTAGQERYNAISVLAYRNIKGIMLMYDITSLHSFNMLKRWIENINENVSHDVTKVLVGNKCDAPEEKREVNFDTGLQFASSLKVPFFEISSKDNINVEEAFFTLVEHIRTQVTMEQLDEEIHNLINAIKKKKQEQTCSCNIL